MKVPIFYDPQKPKRQVALCSSFYEVLDSATMALQIMAETRLADKLRSPASSR